MDYGISSLITGLYGYILLTFAVLRIVRIL